MTYRIANNDRRQLVPFGGGTDVTAPAIDDSRGDIRLGIIIAGLFFVIFLGWAAFAPLDSAAYASGQLIVSGQRQSVQHRDGGVVAAIRIVEGQRVQKGDTLIELAGAEVRAQERALAAQLVNSQAQRARLEAELSGAAVITWPAEFSTVTGSRRAAVAEAVRVQCNEYSGGWIQRMTLYRLPPRSHRYQYCRMPDRDGHTEVCWG